jgi:glyoxylase-like metal-dependent hydrolase (beta-lactamase superfamily II)
MQPIVPGVAAFTGLLMGRVYALESTDGLTLIDAGIGPSAGKILKQLQGHGHSPADVKRILITHAHPDHVGGLARLQAATGAQVLAHRLEHPVLEGRLSSARKTSVLTEVQAGEILREVLGGLQVIVTPGHTAGHVCFWQPEQRLLFCGDVLLHLRGLSLPFPFVTVDMAANKRSVKALAELEACSVCFGHGQPLLHDAPSQLRAFAAKF